MPYEDTLITADFHLTSRSLDEYRWEIFTWLVRVIKRKRIKHVFILGDLTDKKDCHESSFVNRLVNELYNLAIHLKSLRILKGNHDYIDENTPFFQFLNKTDNVFYYTYPKKEIIGDDAFLFLPHTKKPGVKWKKYNFKKYSFILMHQCFKGVKTVDGHLLNGLDFKKIGDTGNACLISGDIHNPQKVKKVLYVGAPYPINFNDNYNPRVLLIGNDGRLKIIRRMPIKKRRYVFTEPFAFRDIDLEDGDQLKIVFELPPEEFPHWEDIQAEVKAFCKKRQIVLRGLELKRKDSSKKSISQKVKTNNPKQIYKQFCRFKKVNKSIRVLGEQYL